ncbi:Cell surface protein [Methanosarcina siciliae HI350]|uniref:Cell surface protein n=1 Tax=Methanosarcina siciliae HI350 TaxID=1434119 RepID=A0A0E3PDM7_9EURY|nr:PGF-pre-PGF domain-containing protein [Methanosarcina siciliae]AKB31815.1 Cell surface protein [Methanosarcina siciliae HI350]
MWKMNKELSSLFILIFALQVFAGSAAATTIYVDSDGSGNYTTVQDALDNAVDGNTIIVRPGNYDEDLAVDVSVTLIGSSGYPTVGKIEVNRQSQISGLTITGGVRFEQAGMSCIIRNNKFDECGVSIGNNYACGNQTIIDNLFTDSPIGVFTYDSIDNKITGNTFQNCHTGIELTYGIGRHVAKDNTFQDCDVGIRLIEDSATIYNNYFSSDINLVLEDDGDARLNTTKTAGTNIIDGPYIGGNFWGSPSGDGFSQTHPDTNGDGIAEEEYQVDEGVIDYLPLVTPRTEPEPVLPIANFRANTTHGNAPLSVLFTDTSQNATGLSWDVNGDGVEDSNAASFAYTYTSRGTYEAKLTVSNANGTDTETAVITVMEEEIPILPVANFTVNKTSGYYPLTVLFTDTSQNATGLSWDVNGDGVEDSNAASFAYTYTSRGTYEAKLTVSNANGTDTETAVITVMEEEIPILPVANFTVNKTSGYYPLNVLFTDTSQNATGLSWDVNGDGVEDSNAASFAYTYTSRGTYEAKLTVSNANGTDTETATIDVVKKSSSGSSGGGGGGGGSPEPAKNVKVKELAQVFITNGKAIKFEFKKNATCIVYVGFDAKKNAGKTTTIVEELKGKSSLVSELPAGEVYKSFNVWVGNSGYATSKNIENPVICFKVENTWIEDENVDKASITLNRYSDKKWEQLPAKISGEDDTYLYFTSDVPGFSSFAITGTSTTASEIVTGNGTSLETRALQDDGNESTDMDTQEEQEGSTKFSDIPPVYGIIGIFVLGLICVIIYLKLPK